MKGLFIINPSSGKQNIDSMLREIMATMILDQICSHVDVFYTKGKDDAKNRAAELKQEIMILLYLLVVTVH